MTRNFIVRRIVDVAMTAAIVILMAYQITGEAVHEWMGIAMFVLFILHTVLNRFWYKGLVRGRYSAVRILQTVLDLALLAAFTATAVTGMLMSQYAVPFLRVPRLVGSTQSLHLAFSHWSFILISAHLGLHRGMMIRPLQKKRILMTVLSVAAVLAGGYGLLLSFENGVYSYLTFQMFFANFDYSKTALWVFTENVLMMISWAMITYEITQILQSTSAGIRHRRLTSLGMIAAEVIAAVVFSIL